MRERSFIDTNVFVYADDRDAGDKRDAAQALIGEAFSAAKGVISTQVLQEFYAVSTRKLGVPPATARRKLELMARLELVVVRLDIILGAVDLQRLHGLSFWDALVVRSASVAGCTILLSEDLRAGQIIDGVRVTNPFVAGSDPPWRRSHR